jgi:hypothetical protein
MIGKAINLGLPSIRMMVAEGTWGPKGVAIVVESSLLDKPFIHVMEELGDEEDWETLYGEGKNFRTIALQKVSTARKGLSSANVVQNEPWALKAGDSFYQGAVVRQVGDMTLVVSASGAFGQTDEAIAEFVMTLIVWQCALTVRALQEDGINHVE